MASYGHSAESDEAFYADLGKCITAWADIEGALFELFDHALGADTEKARLIFWKMNILKTRLDYASDLVRLCAEKGEKKSLNEGWQKIRQSIKTASEFRNKLAHNPTYHEIEFEENIRNVTFSPIAIVRNPFSDKKEFPIITKAHLEAHLTRPRRN